MLGPDGKSRTVLSTTKGYGKLYQIIPVKGTPYVVNDAHLLSLKTSGTSNLTLSDGTKITAGSNNPVFIEAETLYKSNTTAKHCLRVGIQKL